MTTIKSAVFVSGRGSNLKSLIDRQNKNYEIVLVVSDKDDAPAFEYARAARIPTLYVEHQSRLFFATITEGVLIEAGVDLIALAGFMKILDAGFVERWHNRIINIHPSLLPDFPGLHPHRRAIQAGVKVSGATVHYVIPEVDAGPVVGQVTVNIWPNDTEETLVARILEVEHGFYPICMDYVARRLQKEKT